MFSEAHLDGILFAPIVVYCLVGAGLFVVVRAVLGRLGILQWFWHGALVELSLYICITGAVILLADRL